MPPHPGPPPYYNIRKIHHIAVNDSLTLLKMGKRLPETCRADSKINKIVIVASSWSFILFSYIDGERSNKNQIIIRSLHPLTVNDIPPFNKNSVINILQ